MRRRFLNNGNEKNYLYFTIESIEDGLTVSLTENECLISIDNGKWISLSANTVTPAINIGQKIQFKIDNPTISVNEGIGRFTISKKCNVSGNIMSLLYGDDFSERNSLTGKKYAFLGLFYDCKNIVDASKLILPATTLASDCYSYMFKGCTSLVTAPELPATVLVNNCYAWMFYGCSKLNYIKMLATNISASYCLYSWVGGVASIGTFIKHPNMTSLPSGISGIPSGWTVEDYVETNLITFTIDGTEYQAEEGMTLEQWVNSGYNTDGYFIAYDKYIRKRYNNQDWTVKTNNGVCIKTDFIINTNYLITNEGFDEDFG